MALPVAQLGYMPNINTPSGGGHYTKPNPWRDLAIQAIADAASSGVKNEMSPDYTQQAQAEGLPVDPNAQKASFIQQFLHGPTTSQAQLEQLRGNASTQQVASMQEAAALNRQKNAQGFTADQNSRDRTSRENLQTSAQSANWQLQKDQQDAAAQLAAGGWANQNQIVDKTIASEEARQGRALNQQEKDTITRGILDNVGQITQRAPENNPMYGMLKATMPPGTTMPTSADQVQRYMSLLQSLGIKTPAATSAFPGVPLVYPQPDQSDAAAW